MAMVLTIDIGNTNIVVGCHEGRKTHFIERLSTVRTKTEMEYAVDLITLLDLNGVDRKAFEGCVISSVVPQITNAFRLAAQKVLCVEPLVLGPGVKTGLNIKVDNPASVGADLVATAVAGIAEYPVPLAIIDLGTASTVVVVDEQKRYIGGLIYPGVSISLDALTSHASQLGGIGIDVPKRVIGKNTTDCMKSGILYSNAAALDGILERIEEELGQKVMAVATGGLAGKIIPLCRRTITIDPELLLKGLLIIYEKNR